MPWATSLPSPSCLQPTFLERRLRWSGFETNEWLLLQSLSSSASLSSWHRSSSLSPSLFSLGCSYTWESQGWTVSNSLTESASASCLWSTILRCPMCRTWRPGGKAFFNSTAFQGWFFVIKLCMTFSGWFSSPFFKPLAWLYSGWWSPSSRSPLPSPSLSSSWSRTDISSSLSSPSASCLR